MGITCRIVRDSNGNIDYIESNDGQKSILFDNLRSLYGTEKALEYYALTESENFKDVQEVTKEDFTFSGQETLNKLEETGLADNVYQMTSEEIEAKLIELGVEADVARQVSQPGGYYSNANSAFSNLKDKNVKNVQGWMKALTDVQKNGGIKNVNQELGWIGLEDYLNEYVKENNPKAGNIPSSVVEDYIKSNQIEIIDVKKQDYLEPVPLTFKKLNQFDEDDYGSTISSYEEIEEVYEDDEVGYQIVKTDEGFYVRDERTDNVFKDDNYENNIFSTFEEAVRIAGLHLADRNKISTEETKYSGHQLKGGENYREVLLTMPPIKEKIQTVVTSKFEVKTSNLDTDRKEVVHNGFVLDEFYPNDGESAKDSYTYYYTKSGKFSQSKGEIEENQEDITSDNYRSSHWDEVNILAHVRMNEKTLPDGRRVLIVNEIQSDWQSQGRKGGFNTQEVEEKTNSLKTNLNKAKQDLEEIEKELDLQYNSKKENNESKGDLRKRDKDFNVLASKYNPAILKVDDLETELNRHLVDNRNSVPNMPYANTDQYIGLVMRKTMQMASQEGYDGIAFATGQQSADMYSLSQQVDKININPQGDIKSVYISMKNNGDDTVFINQEGVITESASGAYNGKQAEDVLGKDLTKKILETTEDTTLEGEGLEFGGEGMKAFYDKIVPKVVQKEAQRFDKNAKLETVDFNPKYTIQEDNGLFFGVDEKGNDIENSGGNTREEAVKNTELSLGIVKDKLSLGVQPYLPLTQSIKDSVSQGIPQFQKSGIDKITNGFVVGKDVYLNKDTATENTQIHEFNHLYQKQLKRERPEVYKKGLNLIKAELTKNNSEIKDVIDFVKTSQPDLEGEKLFEEILTELVGRKGLELLIKEKNKAKSSGIIDWLSEVWKEIKSMLGISSMSDEEVLKLNLEDFTKASATDLLSGSKLSKKETIKVEKNEVNGKLVYEPFFKGKKMGALRLLPYNGGYRVDSVIVYDKFQKKGVARNLYKYAINDLSKQGISISSLNIRAPYAEKIWEGLVNEGIATKDGNDYRAFREPKVSEVLEYANETEEPLTKEQSVQAIDTLASFGINNSLELFEKLKEAFVKDGAIVFDRKKLEKAGYNSYEITSILTNRDLQQQIKENIYKVKNTELSIDLEGLEVLKTDEVNIFGKQTVYVKSEREAVNEIVDGEIRGKKTNTIQTLNKTYPKTLPEIDTRPFETILKVTENVAKNNPEKLKKVAQAMQEEALKYGVDLRGIENKIYPIQRLKSFTENLVNYISEPNNNFSEVYDKFFEVSQLPKVENEGNDIKLDTELSEYELFRDHNLVRKEGNTYTKVSPENIEDLYNYFLRQQNGKQSNTEQRDRTRWNSSRGNQTLEGAPIVEGVTGADPELTYWAEEYAKRNNIPYKRQSSYVEVDESRAKRIAEAYDKMEHNPSDPKVKEAFQNLINQTIAQYRILEEAGYKFYLFDETNDPYNGNPYNAMRDLRSNKVMGSFATEAGFGSGATELDVEDNPMLQDTGIQWGYGSVEGEQKRVLVNDLFRAVHDAFGHGLEGSGFRARGEENAWQAHARLFTGSALGAITSETRGQNSWLNYGKYAEQNRTAKVEDTIFADQKTGLMPEWTWTEGFDKGKETELKTKEDIQAKTPELEVEDYQTDSDILEALFIWKNFLGYPIKTKSNRKAPFKGMTNNPFKVVTADGIVLKNNDTLTRAKADLYEEEVVKQYVDYQDEVREKVSLGEIIPEKIKTDYTIIEDGVLMTKNNTNQFLRTPLANYELIYQDGNLSFYKDVLGAEKNLSDIDFTKYLNESVKPDNYIVAKNSYSKQELEEINNKYFSCK